MVSKEVIEAVVRRSELTQAMIQIAYAVGDSGKTEGYFCTQYTSNPDGFIGGVFMLGELADVVRFIEAHCAK